MYKAITVPPPSQKQCIIDVLLSFLCSTWTVQRMENDSLLLLSNYGTKMIDTFCIIFTNNKGGQW